MTASVIIPAFNVSRRLPPYLDEIVGFFEGRGGPCECVVVDDGSTDGTADVVRPVSSRGAAVKALVLPPRNRGEGDARPVAAAGSCGIADSQCGFKAFSARAAQNLFGALKTQGFGFDVELLLRAQAAGYGVLGVAVNWNDQSGSKVGLLKDGPRVLGQVLIAAGRIRFGR